MTLKNAINFFESLKMSAVKKSELKIYNQFIETLIKLEKREFTINEIQSIELELERLNLISNPVNSKKFFNNALRQFKSFLKDTFSLASKNYYTNIGVSSGVLFGVVFGVLLGERFEKSLGISFGICIGLFVGSYIGRLMDARAKESGNIL